MRAALLRGYLISIYLSLSLSISIYLSLSLYIYTYIHRFILTFKDPLYNKDGCYTWHLQQVAVEIAYFGLIVN